MDYYFQSETLEDLCIQLAYLDKELEGLNFPEILVEELREDLALQICLKIPKEERKDFFWTDGKKSIYLSVDTENAVLNN